MPLYRKKTAVIEAIKFDGENGLDIEAWSDHVCESMEHSKTYWMQIMTLDGVMRADTGDWIIRFVNGEYCACKPDIFEATYEPSCNDVESIVAAGGVH